jgi:rSAM/selenodomain-associated transferase 2
MNSISIIIPVYNEEETLLSFLEDVQAKYSNQFPIEIIVVDGGSTDKTKKIVQACSGVQLVFSEKGRAKQMNAGAIVAQNSILYFLHCDSIPPKNFDVELVENVKKGNLAGCFKMQFDYNHWFLKIITWFTRFNHISCRGGDQSLFVTKKLFLQINGFDESYTIYEDNEICKRLYEQKQFAVIQRNIITSARRFKKNGVLKLYYHFFIIHLKRRLGHSAESLNEYYKNTIQ